ncbi:MAG: hypothetical protein V4501_08650 [Pseudomonadota bacterium]
MRVIRHLFLLLTLLIFSPAWAYGMSDGPEGLLNRVTLLLSAEQYVPTKSALVSVGVNAGVSDSALQTIQDEILKKLSDVSNKGDWHIISFNRTLDQSGLEKVQIEAQARLPASALPNLRDKAKSMSKPGETYTLDNVEFTPSADELRDANTALRGQVYQQAKDEMERLNKVYSDQKFYVHSVDFLNNVIAVPRPMAMNMMAMKNANLQEGGNNLAVGDKLILNATVVLASSPDSGLIKMIH